MRRFSNIQLSGFVLLAVGLIIVIYNDFMENADATNGYILCIVGILLTTFGMWQRKRK